MTDTPDTASSGLPEEEQAAALRAVQDAGARRAALLAQAEQILTHEIRPAAVRAAQLGAGRTRIRELAQVGPAVLYRWWTEAGIPVREKRPTTTPRRRARTD
ncbi:hypothetical protein ACF073_40820 [Streptomyces sp. NPDC015171]|uniref:hypothetical protein n=1 Tax=Streptomyces sp. NPDC015171 TaxID=3364945 RepID=UPI0036F806D9